MYNKLITLGIETSCDDTGVSLYNNSSGILSEFVYSQTVHYDYGGVVPDLASKDHLEKLLSLIIFTFKKSKIKINFLNCIAYSFGPGLKDSLLIGASLSKSIGFALSIPVIGINHLEAHIFSAFLFNKIKFPCLGIVISGAHTIFLKLNSYKNINFLFETLDDSIGEVFDKIARALDLFPYNGYSIELLSRKNKKFKHLKLLKHYNNSNNDNLSFSGLKTSVLNIINFNTVDFNKNNIAYNFQNTLVKSILNKCKKYFIFDKFNSILISGGVSCNNEFRIDLKNFTLSKNLNIYFPSYRHCMDNGTMVAFLGFIKLIQNFVDKTLFIKVFPRVYF